MRGETDRDRVIRLGRQALKNLDKDKNWTWWRDVGEAILIGREECKGECGLSDTNLPPGSWGGAYNRAFGEWLVREKLDFDKAARSRLLEIMDNLPAVEAWRRTLSLSERRKFNHPDTVLRKWKAATRVPAPAGDKKPTLRDSVADLSEEIEALKRTIADKDEHIRELESAREFPADAPPKHVFSVDGARKQIRAVVDIMQFSISAGAACGLYGKIDPKNLQDPPLSPQEATKLLKWLDDLPRAVRSYAKFVKTEKEKRAANA